MIQATSLNLYVSPLSMTKLHSFDVTPRMNFCEVYYSESLAIQVFPTYVLSKMIQSRFIHSQASGACKLIHYEGEVTINK